MLPSSTTVIETLLGSGQPVEFAVSGPSMAPTLVAGDSIVVAPYRTLRQGDVVLCRLARGLVAHRIVRIRGEQLELRGDAPGCDSELVDRACVLGQVSVARRDGLAISLRLGWRTRLKAASWKLCRIARLALENA